ncbi:MAG: sialidase family protein [Planctomycetota bacterium]
MKKIIATSLFVLAAIALLGLSTASAAEELWVIKDGVLNKDALTDSAKSTGKGHVYCGGRTVDGVHLSTPHVGGLANYARFITAKSAVGAFEFKVVFSCTARAGKWVYPKINISDRGYLYFSKDGRQVLLSGRKAALPLKAFAAPSPVNAFDGGLHSLAVKRVGDRLSFYCDDKKLNEQPIDPDVNLHLWFDALFLTIKTKSIKLTADELSDDLKTVFKSEALIQEIYKGSGVPPKPEYGKACRYRIPALAVSTKGTILAFAEARRTTGADVGDIDAVVKRSEDNGKTWGPEIVVWDDGANSINNPCPIVDPKTGRIWCCMGRYNPYPTSNQHVAYSDDDGKTWSKPRDITQAIQATIEPKRKCWIPGPGAGIVMRHEKYAGRLVIPMGFAPLVVYSDDHGETWKGGGWGGSDGGEAKCAELLDGSLLFNGRTGTKKRALSIVTEGGTKNATKTWYADDLPDPSCQGAIVRHSWPKDGKPGILLYSGPGVVTARAQGTLFASYDDGKTWPWKLEYYQGPSGYSDACVLPDGRVAVLFEKDGKAHLGFTILPAPPVEPPAKPGK